MSFLVSELPFSAHGIIGSSPVMKTLDCQIATAARSELPVLITGESGTGKELVARAIHNSSDRSDKPFISFNCGALTETLLESELFGYERGAFTGANQTRKGLFEAAQKGTIFLDEIGEMSTSCQVKLLRVLQESAVRPVGAHNEIPVDVRVVTATNRNLPQEIALGRFRQDLFYRIAVLTIVSPPLRERASDIPPLVEHFLREAAKDMKRVNLLAIAPDAIEALCLYTWPGNVRQLQNVVQRLVAGVTHGHLITGSEVNDALREVGSFEANPQVPLMFREEDSLDEFLDRIVLGLYKHFRALTGNHADAARLMRVDRVSLYSRLSRARRRMNGNGSNGKESMTEEDWLD
jgi:transcriptional regulator with PAS, ATPase and Fis domain